MNRHATQTRRQMIGSALGLVGAGFVAAGVGSGRLVRAVDTIGGTVDVEGAAATERAIRISRDETSNDPDEAPDEANDVPAVKLTFPVDVTGGKLVMPNGFGGASVARGSGRHNGVDIGNGANCGSGRGRPLLACADGVYLGTSYGSTYGRKITLRDLQGNHFHYHHLDAIVDGLAPGDPVRRGQVVGFMGSSGNTSWAHLHFEVWVGGRSPQQGGQAVDPEPWLPLPIDGVTVGFASCS